MKRAVILDQWTVCGLIDRLSDAEVREMNRYAGIPEPCDPDCAPGDVETSLRVLARVSEWLMKRFPEVGAGVPAHVRRIEKAGEN